MRNGGGQRVLPVLNMYWQETDCRMFLDKLWVRIRGELLSLREDASAGDDLRARAYELLERMQDHSLRAGRDEPAVDEGLLRIPKEASHPEHPRSRSLADLERDWQELMRQRDKQKARPAEPGMPSPNPRRLG
jgi:hypothetical protein